MDTQQCDLALIGLAVMGENLALNIAGRGHRIACRSPYARGIPVNNRIV